MPVRAKPIRVYLASIFDTLLSSQGADAHHRRPLGRCWGNLSTLDHPPPARQLGGSDQLMLRCWYCPPCLRADAQLQGWDPVGVPGRASSVRSWDLVDPIVVPLRGPAGSSRLRPSVPPLWGATRWNITGIAPHGQIAFISGVSRCRQIVCRAPDLRKRSADRISPWPWRHRWRPWNWLGARNARCDLGHTLNCFGRRPAVLRC